MWRDPFGGLPVVYTCFFGRPPTLWVLTRMHTGQWCSLWSCHVAITFLGMYSISPPFAFLRAWYMILLQEWQKDGGCRLGESLPMLISNTSSRSVLQLEQGCLRPRGPFLFLKGAPQTLQSLERASRCSWLIPGKLKHFSYVLCLLYYVCCIYCMFIILFMHVFSVPFSFCKKSSSLPAALKVVWHCLFKLHFIEHLGQHLVYILVVTKCKKPDSCAIVTVCVALHTLYQMGENVVSRVVVSLLSWFHAHASCCHGLNDGMQTGYSNCDWPHPFFNISLSSNYTLSGMHETGVSCVENNPTVRVLIKYLVKRVLQERPKVN